MDPDANLAEQRRIVAQLAALSDTMDDEPSDADSRTIERLAFRLSELVEALDNWIARGGALPRAWSPNR